MKRLSRLWRILGLVMGEGEYGRYCAHLRARHTELKIPSERDFYLQRLKEKYSRPTRCC